APARHTSVDVSSAPNASTRTHFGGADRSAQSWVSHPPSNRAWSGRGSPLHNSRFRAVGAPVFWRPEPTRRRRSPPPLPLPAADRNTGRPEAARARGVPWTGRAGEREQPGVAGGWPGEGLRTRGAPKESRTWGQAAGILSDRLGA